ncbi:MAG: hypothetical protein C0594_01525 [Marinilabiliales bacterium]|nr:MAG: hypothetical protein C0594_01525 [Marinilabiliales bacterium]
MIFHRVLLISIVLLFGYQGFAQYHLLFLSGEQDEISNYKLDEESELLLFKNKRDKIRDYDLFSIFSITDSTGQEYVIYSPDTLEAMFLTVDQMRSFVYGEKNAFENYKAPVAFASGVFVGLASPIIIYSMKYNVLYSFLPAASYSAVFEAIPISDQKTQKFCSEKMDDDYYLRGFKEGAKAKRVQSVIKGSLIGIGIGIATSIIYYQGTN